MKKTTICLFLFGLSLALLSCGKKPARTASTAVTQIECSPKHWNFGDLSEGEEVCHTFYLKNTGRHPLIIQNIETGCGCTTVNYDPIPIPPGKEGKIEIAFNSKGRYGKQYKEIRIFANIPKKTATLSFTAYVK